MALFNKIFQTRKRKSSFQGESAEGQPFSSNQRTNESLFPFSGEQVRVLLFRECDWTGRRLLFDSSAVQKINKPSNNQQSTTSKKQSNKEQLPNSCDNDATDPPRTYIDICNGYGYTYDHASCESNNIGEMVFGSVAMSFRGTSLKVHWLREPNRILFSEVFLSPIFPSKSFCRGTSANDMKANESGNCETQSNQSKSFSVSLSLCMTDKLTDVNNKQQAVATNPLDVPSSLDSNNYAFSGCDSGYSGTDIWTKMSNSSYGYRSNRSSVVSMFSTDPSIVSSRKLSVDSAILVDAALNGRSSDGCLQRRIRRNMSTSFENNLSRNDFIGYFDECIRDQSSVNIPGSIVRRHSDQCESRSNPEMIRQRKNSGKDCLKPTTIHFSSYTPRSKNSQRRSKIGLAVCIRFSESAEEEMQLFCSEHIALLESMLCRLRAAAETAYLNQKRFLELMLHAWFATTSWITDLFTAPRIQEPVWFSLSNGYSDRPHTLAKHFMTELCWLLNSADTKDTNFFVSTLLTAILTNHLGWVATVAPIVHSSVSNDQVITINQNQSKLSEISKFHPYNVLWAQLGDLYGSIGNPSRLAKTIVCGAHTVTINKVLSILTYFVRCGEIQRVKSTKVLNKNEIEDLFKNKVQHRPVAVTSMSNEVNLADTKQSQVKGLSRSKTCLKEIATMCHEEPLRMNKNTPFESIDINLTDFVQQPKIQYYHETLCDDNGVINAQTEQYPTMSTIKVMVTSPNNDRFEYETASEAIDFTLKKIQTTIDETDNAQPKQQTFAQTTYNDENDNKSQRSLWSIDTVTDGISIDNWRSSASDATNVVLIKNNDLKRSHSLKTKSNTLSNLRRSKTVREIQTNHWKHGNRNLFGSDHITNSEIYKSNRIEPLAPLIQGINLSNGSKMANNEQTPKVTESVVFVLGDNEVLSGLKPISSSPNFVKSEKTVSLNMNSPPGPLDEKCESNLLKSHNSQAIGENHSSNLPSTLASAPKPNNIIPEKKKKHCTHKKHSGVKFNFEQYPQIVTNYMKNKNLDITNYDFLEKGLKLEQENAFNCGASSTSLLPMLAPEDVQEQDEQEEEEQCECCANTFRILQTPSNATELEFSNDDASYPVPIIKPTIKKLGTSDEISKPSNNSPSQTEGDAIRKVGAADVLNQSHKCDGENKNGRMSSSANSVESKESLDLITLPIPKTEITDDSKNRCHVRPGYVPSLFVGITDHFIPDMVVQGITAPIHTWEPILKQNLTLASHCATFEQTPTENVALIANIDKWDVRLVSSQTYSLSSNGLSGSVGMSQLVSAMLETVHAMWMAGTSAYQCMSFLESKLKEIYLQSETLAAFLLATEFCSLNTVTTALNLSANDVPLLLSVASIHSPQVTKKYGISFR